MSASKPPRLRLVPSNGSEQSVNDERKWRLTKPAFDLILETFDPDRETASDLYLKTRRDIIYYFEGRGFFDSIENADEVFDRVARRLAEGEQVTNLRSYLFGVARLVLLEMNRSETKRRKTLDDLSYKHAVAAQEDEDERLSALRKCLGKQPQARRHMVLSYYSSDQKANLELRESLAKQSGVDIKTLRVKVQRIRNDLERCVEITLRQSRKYR